MKSNILEAKPKNPKNIDSFDKPLGRKATNVSTRIAQIKRVVKKYGIDNRVYDDKQRKQALEDYKRSIENSLNVSVEICSSERDGNNEYSIKIHYNDGATISGYIKLSSTEDGNYESSLILWPKEDRNVNEAVKKIHLTERALRIMVGEAMENL